MISRKATPDKLNLVPIAASPPRNGGSGANCSWDFFIVVGTGPRARRPRRRGDLRLRRLPPHDQRLFEYVHGPGRLAQMAIENATHARSAEIRDFAELSCTIVNALVYTAILLLWFLRPDDDRLKEHRRQNQQPRRASTSDIPLMTHSPQLSPDELLFRDTVRDFARTEITPLVRSMDEAQKFDPKLLRKLFDLGLMGIQVPDQYGGAAGTLFEAVLAVEEISAVDPAVGVLVDVQNTLVISALLRWANDEQKQKYLPHLATKLTGAYALSSASGSDAFALQYRTILPANGDLHPQRPETLDHQRPQSRPLPRLRHTRPRRRLQRHHLLPRRKRHPRLFRRTQRRQTRHPRQQHLRTHPQRLSPPRDQHHWANPARELQRSPSRPSARAASASGSTPRPCLGEPGATPPSTLASASNSASPSPTSRPCSSSSRAWRWMIRKPPASSSTTQPASRTPAGNTSEETAMAKLFASEVAERTASLARRNFRRRRFRQGLPGRKALPPTPKSAKSTKAPVSYSLATIAKLTIPGA